MTHKLMAQIDLPTERVGKGIQVLIGLTALLTLMDLFGPQAIAPLLVDEFHCSAACVGVATNAAVIGMAISGLLSGMMADRFDRKAVMVGALLLLSIPTLMIGMTSDVMIFSALRIVQGLIMCASFTVAIAYVAEEWGPSGAAPMVMVAYVTGNVASNLFGRLLAGMAAQYASWHYAFFAMAAINLAGGLLLLFVLPAGRRREREQKAWADRLAPMKQHLADRRIVGACGVGFLILFCFISVFTYVNFAVSDPPFNLTAGSIGCLYIVFAASLVATPLAGPAVRAIGDANAIIIGAIMSLGGLLLTLLHSINTLGVGLALVGIGTFFCQAVATGFTGRAGGSAKAAASGLYLACYYSGGICGAVALGPVYQVLGWPGCVAVTGTAFSIMAVVPLLTWNRAHELDQTSPA